MKSFKRMRLLKNFSFCSNNLRFRIPVILFAALTILSCGTTDNVFDEGIPSEESAYLKISPEWTVKAYNGIPVALETGFGGTGYRIPAGETELLMDLYHKIGNVIYTAEDVVFRFNYEAGGNYLIFFHFVNDEGELMKTSLFGGGYKTSLVLSKDEIKNIITFENMTFN